MAAGAYERPGGRRQHKTHTPAREARNHDADSREGCLS